MLSTYRVLEVTPFGTRNITPKLQRKVNALILGVVFPADTVRRSLRFATKLIAGNTFNHIVNDATFGVALIERKRSIEPGESLCARRRWLDSKSERGKRSKPTCPGCVAIAQGLAARGL